MTADAARSERPWPPGAVTGLGSMPGTDPEEAVRLVLGELAELPYLPELPARGLGADMVGRSAALLVDLPVEWQPHGWTVTSGPGRDLVRARDFLLRDLDALTEQGQGLDVIKVQICGPMTLGAALELPKMHKMLADHGALADLTASLVEGTRLHLADLAARLPGTRVVLQVDEPSLPDVLAGRVATPSGLGTVGAIDRPVAEAALSQVLQAAAAGHRVVHCCADGMPFDLLRGAGADAIAVDATRIRASQLDALGESIDAGVALWLGVAPAVDATITLDDLRDRIVTLWKTIGFNRDSLAASVVPTPTCGLAGASIPYVRRVFEVLRDVGRSLTD